jgi:hypothetical protein
MIRAAQTTARGESRPSADGPEGEPCATSFLACLPRQVSRPRKESRNHRPVLTFDFCVLPFDFPLKSPMGKGKQRTYKTGRATLAFRQRHFVASNAGGFVLTLIMYVDTIITCYCGVRPCPGLPSSRSRTHSSYEVSRAKSRRQNPRDENPGLGIGDWGLGGGRRVGSRQMAVGRRRGSATRQVSGARCRGKCLVVRGERLGT